MEITTIGMIISSESIFLGKRKRNKTKVRNGTKSRGTWQLAKGER